MCVCVSGQVYLFDSARKEKKTPALLTWHGLNPAIPELGFAAGTKSEQANDSENVFASSLS